LELKSPWHIFEFYWLAISAMMQARAADGNISAEAKMINGVRHTLSVWESKAHMRQFVHSGAHLKAMQSFTKIATGKTFGYESNELPSWERVHLMWQNHGMSYEQGH
jgi:hypothetical protein